MNKEIVVALAEVYVPLFRVSPPPLQTRISYLLPSPRTLIGILASGLGKYLGLNPEAKIGGEKIRRRLTWDVIGSNVMMTCRAGAWVYKTGNILRVWLIERHDLLREMSKKETRPTNESFPREKIMDAIIHEYVSCDKLIIYAVTNLNRFAEGLKTLLREAGLDEVDSSEVPEILAKSMKLVDRVGDSESIATTIRASIVKILGVTEEGILNTMSPMKWIEVHDSNTNIIQDMPITPLIEEGRISINKYRSQEMILPLRPKFEKILYYENAPYRAKARKGYRILILESGDSVIVPEYLLDSDNGKRRKGRKGG